MTAPAAPAEVMVAAVLAKLLSGDEALGGETDRTGKSADRKPHRRQGRRAAADCRIQLTTGSELNRLPTGKDGRDFAVQAM